MTDQSFKNYFTKGQKQSQKNSKCCTEYSYCEDSNLSNRQKMVISLIQEDFFFIQDSFTFENTGLFGIFDGHGGQDVARICKDKFSNIFKQELQKQKNAEQAFNTTFQRLDSQIKLTGAGDVGSTACIAYVQKSINDSVVNIANIGDTRCVLFADKAVRVSVDHKGSNQDEKVRVQSKGGDIINDRLGGTLAITRAFGDWNLKNKGLTAEPYQNKISLQRGQIMVIASDGVWDEAFDLTKKFQDTDDISKCIVYNAIQRGSRDNISCLVVKF